MSAPDRSRLLRAYIADHLQLLRAAHDLARRVAEREGGDLARLLDAVAGELREQERVAIAFLQQLGAGAPWLRLTLGTIAERIGRLKPNGRFLQPSPLAPVFELGVLEGLLESTARFWRTLEGAGAANEDIARRYAEAADVLVPPLERWRLHLGAHALRSPAAPA